MPTSPNRRRLAAVTKPVSGSHDDIGGRRAADPQCERGDRVRPAEGQHPVRPRDRRRGKRMLSGPRRGDPHRLDAGHTRRYRRHQHGRGKREPAAGRVTSGGAYGEQPVPGAAARDRDIDVRRRPHLRSGELPDPARDPLQQGKVIRRDCRRGPVEVRPGPDERAVGVDVAEADAVLPRRGGPARADISDDALHRGVRVGVGRRTPDEGRGLVRPAEGKQLSVRLGCRTSASAGGPRRAAADLQGPPLEDPLDVPERASSGEKPGQREVEQIRELGDGLGHGLRPGELAGLLDQLSGQQFGIALKPDRERSFIVGPVEALPNPFFEVEDREAPRGRARPVETGRFARVAEPRPSLVDGEKQGVPIAVQRDPREVLDRTRGLSLAPEPAPPRVIHPPSLLQGGMEALAARPGEPEDAASGVFDDRGPEPVRPIGHERCRHGVGQRHLTRVDGHADLGVHPEGVQPRDLLRRADASGHRQPGASCEVRQRPRPFHGQSPHGALDLDERHQKPADPLAKLHDAIRDAEARAPRPALDDDLAVSSVEGGNHPVSRQCPQYVRRRGSAEDHPASPGVQPVERGVR